MGLEGAGGWILNTEVWWRNRPEPRVLSVCLCAPVPREGAALLAGAAEPLLCDAVSGCSGALQLLLISGEPAHLCQTQFVFAECSWTEDL